MAALVAGVVLGAAGQVTEYHGFWRLSEVISPLGSLWLNALQMSVVPLVITQLLAALVKRGDQGEMGVLSGKSLALIVLFLVGAGAFSMLVAPPILGLFQAPVGLTDAIQVDVIPASAQAAAEGGGVSLGDWLVGLIPRNPLQAAADGNLIQVLVFTVLLGLAVGQLPGEQKNPLAETFRGLADAMMEMVRWILVGTPLGVFALFLPMALENGPGSLGLIAIYLFLSVVTLMGATLLLYPITAAGGRISLLGVARALAPAQLVAISTQSSLASLPALIVGGREEMDLPDQGTAFVLPLCVSTFKFTQPIYSHVNLIFLAFLFGIPLGLADQVVFLVGVIVLSFGVPGVPGGVPFMTLPLFLAAGIPIEGVVLLEVVKTIPDVFMTVSNVTADMSVATILTRKSRESSRAEGTSSFPVAPEMGD